MSNNTETLAIADFLLARIAEDEKVARDKEWEPARVVAECEAKRRIIEREHVECGGHPGPWMPHDDYGPGYCWREDEHNMTLTDLAAVYADHPEYRDEWR
jgi:hypothetical protein